MKSVIALTLGLFAASISAAAAPIPSVTVSLINDQSGRNAAVTIPADGNDRSVHVLFGNSAIVDNGEVKASSAQLTAFPQGVFCIIKDAEKVFGVLNFQKTFADLDGNPAAAIPQDLDAAVINCQI